MIVEMCITVYLAFNQPILDCVKVNVYPVEELVFLVKGGDKPKNPCLKSIDTTMEGWLNDLPRNNR